MKRQQQNSTSNLFYGTRTTQLSSQTPNPEQSYTHEKPAPSKFSHAVFGSSHPKVSIRKKPATVLTHAPMQTPPLLSPAVFGKRISAFDFDQAKKKMRFGNYSHKQYGLVASRSEAGLSLYEKFFLKNHMNKDAVRKALMTAKASADTEYKTANRIMTPATSYPNISHYLMKKPFSPLSNYCKPMMLDTGKTFLNKSERERYKRILSELNGLRAKMLSEPEKSKLFAIAFVDKYFGQDELELSEKHLEHLIEFALLEPVPINPRENILQVIINALSGNFYDPESKADRLSLHKKNYEETHKFEDLIEQYKRETLGNTIEWEEKRVKKNPKIIPKIRTQAKKLSRMLGDILEKSVGGASMSVVNVMGPEKDLLKKADLRAAQKAKLSIERNKLVLEKVLHERSLKRLKRRENRAKLREQKRLEEQKTTENCLDQPNA